MIQRLREKSAGGRVTAAARWLLADLTAKKLAFILLGTAIASFGIHNIHQRASITEGGVIGMILLSNYWLGLSPSAVTPMLDIACYALAFKYLGGTFLKISAVSTVCLSACYKLWETLPFLLPDLSPSPLAAAVIGGMFVGIGVGIVVRQGGSSGGDDALALVISRLTKWRISRSYLITDLTVLALSLTYIPARRIGYSLITVTVSSLLIDAIKEFDAKQAAGSLRSALADLREKWAAAGDMDFGGALKLSVIGAAFLAFFSGAEDENVPEE